MSKTGGQSKRYTLRAPYLKQPRAPLFPSNLQLPWSLGSLSSCEGQGMASNKAWRTGSPSQHRTRDASQIMSSLENTKIYNGNQALLKDTSISQTGITIPDYREGAEILSLFRSWSPQMSFIHERVFLYHQFYIPIPKFSMASECFTTTSASWSLQRAGSCTI